METSPRPDAGTGRTGARAEIPDALRRDVRRLADALGQVVAEADGAEVLADVERLRRLVIDAREGDPAADGQAAAMVAGLSLDRAEQVARAFAVYFHLVNLAEDRHRARALRERGQGAGDGDGDGAAAEGTGPGAGPGGADLAGAAETLLRAAGPAGLAAALAGVRVSPVLTAHPTEARRRAVVAALARISDQLDRLDHPGAGGVEQGDARRRLLEEMDLLWRTALLRATRPGPLDEVRAAMSVFDDTLFRAVPAVYRRLSDALQAEEAGRQPPPVPAFLRWGSWVGGDRDGNPYVTAAVTRDALTIQSEHVLRALQVACTRIARTLTLDEAGSPPSTELALALEDAAAAYPQALARAAASSPGEPHRTYLLLAAERLAATLRRDADLGYRRPDELLADVALVQDSLARAGACRAAYGEVQHLRWQVETFGFHLASLEIRQHSAVHAAALRALLGDDGLPSARALDTLGHDGWPAALPAVDDQTREVLATFRVMAGLQERFGPDACRRYVVSFTRSAADLAAVRALARLAVGERPLRLDVVPLFETEDDLRGAVGVLEEWYALPGTLAALRDAGGQVEVMLGYSDSAKDVGPVAAQLALYDAQRDVAAWARRHGLTLTLFHGRGGSLGRGGGPAYRAVQAQAPGSLDGRFKVTEQGEVIFARYGTLPVARRHLEQVAAAVLLASTPDVQQRAARAAERFAALAARLGDAARREYRGLVGTDGFAAFFAQASPLEEIGQLRIGSRPARRGGSADLSGLRAIPWVFAWSQTRVNLPGWYGLGSGLAAALAEPDGLAELRAAYRDWPLFASMIENAEMSLAKADPRIAARYLALGDRPDLAERILAELRRTVDGLLAVTGRDTLLADRRVLGWAIALRTPYIDALSHLQLRALSALRRGDADPALAERLQRLVLLTVNGVAAGLQNTG